VSVPTQGDIVEQTEATETIGKPDEKKRPNDSSKSGQSPTKNVLDKVEGQSCQDDSVANAAVAQDRLMSLAHELIRRKGSCKKGKACSHDHK
jgi:hypothetical protein